VAVEAGGTVASVRGVAERDALAAVLAGRGLAGDVARAAVEARPALETLALEGSARVVARTPVHAGRARAALVDVQSTRRPWRRKGTRTSARLSPDSDRSEDGRHRRTALGLQGG
jgi:hypothetical protein